VRRTAGAEEEIAGARNEVAELVPVVAEVAAQGAGKYEHIAVVIVRLPFEWLVAGAGEKVDGAAVELGGTFGNSRRLRIRCA
jgi:hypothetical protein